MQSRYLALSLATLSLLAACGGNKTEPEPPAPPPAPGTVTLTGVAARGAALAGAAVAATCATGTGTATAATNGAYTITITGGALPCVLQATSSDSATVLRSVATGTGTSVTANVTPLTELLVAQITGQEPAAYLAALNTSQLAGTFTSAKLASGQAAVLETLALAGLNTAGIGDFVTGTLVAANGSTAGNDYDKALDALATQLTTAGTTLAALVTTVAATSAAEQNPGMPPSGGDGASLPPDLLAKAKAPNCSALASGNYRVVKLAPSVNTSGTSPITATELLALDAPNLRFSVVANPADTWAWTANGTCRYSTADGTEIVVSQAGLAVARANIGADDDTVNASVRGTPRLVLGIPVQSIAVSELVGTWNAQSYFADQQSAAENFTIASTGNITEVRCSDQPIGAADSACTVGNTLLPRFASHSDGGFTLTSTDPSEVWVDRAWAYRAGNGEMMLVLLSADGGWAVATKQRTLSLPAVGDTRAFWNLQMTEAGLASDVLGTSARTVTAVDTAAASYTRTASNNGSSVTVPQTQLINRPRNGYEHRPSASVTASDGSVATVREGWFLGLRGMGLTAYHLPNNSSGASNARFGISVRQP